VSHAAVAVVIPCYNSATTIEAAVRSALEQSLEVSEVIVVDDGSTDDSAARAGRLGARCLRQARRGPAAARNAGVRATSAEWLAFLDADDRFLPDKIERQLACAGESDQIVLCCSDAWLVRAGVRTGRKNRGRDVAAALSLTDLVAGNPIICSSVLVRRDVVAAAGYFDEDPELIATEDYDLWLRVAATGGRMRYLDAPLLEYRVAASSLSDDERFLRGVDRSMEKVQRWGTVSGASIARRRASVRLDAAHQRIRRGRAAEARVLLREARRLAGWSPSWARLWLRSWWPRTRGSAGACQ